MLTLGLQEREEVHYLFRFLLSEVRECACRNPGDPREAGFSRKLI